MTTKEALAKILASASVAELKAATAEALGALSIEAQLETRLEAVELKVKEMEVQP